MPDSESAKSIVPASDTTNLAPPGFKTIWAWIKYGHLIIKRVATLEDRVTALEAAGKGPVPADACPSCGERSMRLIHSSGLFGPHGNQTRTDYWGCLKCPYKQERVVRF